MLAAESSSGKDRRGLGGWAVDLLHDGVRGKYPSRGRIWGTVVQVAMSAQARGWSQTQFVSEVTCEERRTNAVGQRLWTRHRLWEQVLAYSRDQLDAHLQLDRAWEAAIQNLADSPAVSTEDWVEQTLKCAQLWHDRLDARVDRLTPTQRAVMHFVAGEVERRRISRVACPCRSVGESVGVDYTVAWRSLRWLTARRFLLCHTRGKASNEEGERRAALYSLPDPEEVPMLGRPTNMQHRTKSGEVSPVLHSAPPEPRRF